MEYMTAHPGFLILLTSRMPTPPHVSRLKGQAGSWVGVGHRGGVDLRIRIISILDYKTYIGRISK